MTDNVNLKPIEHLYLENLMGAQEVLGEETVTKLFEGTDLYYDPKAGTLKSVVDGKITAMTLDQEASRLRLIRKADTNGDLILTPDEAKALIEKSFPKGEAEKISVDDFMKNTDTLIKKRYAILEKNMEVWKGNLAFKPTLDALEVYNFGIYLDDVRQADSVIPLNALHKTAGNVVSFLPVNLARFFTKGRGPVPLLPHGSVPDNWLPIDAWAEHTATGRYHERSAALAKLKQITEEAVKKGESWALDGNFDEALKHLDSDERDLLTDDIPGKKIHDIINIEDDKQRYTALKEFATGERPGFLGYFGGNATGWGERNWFNYTGRHNNIFFARSVMSFLGSKAATSDPDFNNQLHSDANAIRKDILGEGGGFTNTISWGITGLLHLVSFGKIEQTPWREWSDEAEMDGLGRAIDAGIMIYTSAQGLKSWKEMWALRRVGGIKEVWSVMRNEGKWYRPFTREAWAARRLELEAEIARTGEELRKPGWFGRKLAGFKDKLFGKLPPVDEVLNPAQLKLLKGAGKSGSWLMSKLTDGAIILYITQKVDSGFAAHYNPYETDHEVDLDPMPNPLKPDPMLYSAPKK